MTLKVIKLTASTISYSSNSWASCLSSPSLALAFPCSSTICKKFLGGLYFCCITVTWCRRLWHGCHPSIVVCPSVTDVLWLNGESAECSPVYLWYICYPHLFVRETNSF